ncbi:carbohydrate ABC transporter permease [Anoxynatronum buryatiense]|uniref:Carbohydrate ABC transporter membrane protein 1, CUT1 family n=1 Tax=Anoxynatronum buryatiense TaxID=489973 RepID=A0AA45WYZ5_9CLOT|nr:sugar ABC transporter permease [Anoxynatronum buryatiense]SMP71195.1 carbohydrate ABC transporter membrane protein 1, CUT1 family [Anoxynatronum buryatiense]
MVTRSKLPYLLLFPTMTLYGVFFVFPFLYSLFISFSEWHLLTGDMTFVGIQNYRQLAGSHIFKKTIGNTLMYVMTTMPVSIVLGLMYALLIEQTKKAKALYRFVFFIPVVISVAAASLSFSLLYNARHGLINQVMSLVGIQGPNWLNESKSALLALVILGIWQSFGYNVILFIAGIQQLDKEIYEAAAIDGLSPFTRLTRLTLPLLSPVTFFVFVMTTLSSFQVFATVQILTMGGPNNATNMMVFFVWQEAFKFFNTGLATAAATVLFVATMILTLLMVRIVQRKVHYQ